MIKQIKGHPDRAPFEPFRTTTTSGDRYAVIDPHALAIAESYLFYCFMRSDRYAHIRIKQIAALESLESAA